MTTKEKILDILREGGEMRPVDLLNEFTISQQMLHRHIKDLLQDGLIEKIGTSPRVFYRLVTHEETIFADTSGISSDISLLIEENFLHITPTGKELVGVEAFVYWCNKRGFDIDKMAKQYKDVIAKYAKLRKSGLLNATSKMRRAFDGSVSNLCINEVFYVDFYALETFGKTRLGQMLLYAKQSQDKEVIWEIAEMARGKIESLIKNKKIDAVAYVPPTVKRKVQFMKVLENRLALNLPVVVIDKVIGDVAVPQKTLKNFEDRVENAQAGFVLRSSASKFGTVLVIDDAVGSGASLNEIACKLKNAGVAKKVIGVAITGSLNNFDVISEV